MPQAPDTKPNRLARETSPYLLQHAHNPVDWFPWGEDAFDEARRRSVPIFLSIGYSTCYWCHVMERESFEDPRAGRLMSERFVCVKVDREERPDVDDVYMAAVQAMSGRGGWPMSVFLTPPGARGDDDRGLEPFWAATYLPPEPRHGMPSFEQTLLGIDRAWREQRENILRQARNLTESLRLTLEAPTPPVRIGGEHVVQAVEGLLKIYDRANGGFGGAPKFPQPVYAGFLIESWDAAADPEARAAIEHAVRHTLDAMGRGGLFDQVGGGFHRYSVDAQWVVPHFEKMLYDNGLLASLYARAFATWKDPFHARIARLTCEYVLREMTAASDEFYSAQDAEVDGREGRNYVWTQEEMRAALPGELGAFAAGAFGVDRGPNFRDPHHPDDPPTSVLVLTARPDEMASRLGAEAGAIEGRLDEARAGLLRVRNARRQPRLDDKTITSWNGLMIAGLADTGAAIGERRFIDAAHRAANRLWALMDGASGLLRSARAGTARTPAFLEDHACFAAGLLALARASGDGPAKATCIERAAHVVQAALEAFGDAESGGLFDTRPVQSDLIVRTRGVYDGAIPSGQSVMLHALIDLADLTGEGAWLERAGLLLKAMSGSIAEAPVGTIHSTAALLRVLKADPALLERAGIARAPEAPAVQAQGAAPAQTRQAVEVFADQERVTVGRGAPATVRLAMEIREGHHIMAHRATDGAPIPGLIGLEVLLAPGSGEGVCIRADYPDGEPLFEADRPDGSSTTVFAHSGGVELAVTIERTDAPWSGRPMLLVRHQVCTERECLAPATLELDVAIDPA